ncbi:MAG: hypothetical protein MHM6MM_002558 [Cercozoa sp. M6MM]
MTTHFYELFQDQITRLIVGDHIQGEKLLARAKMEIHVGSDSIPTFQYRLVSGFCDNSLAALCARRIGVPQKIINRMEEVRRLFAQRDRAGMRHFADQFDENSSLSLHENSGLLTTERLWTAMSRSDTRSAVSHVCTLMDGALSEASTTGGSVTSDNLRTISKAAKHVLDKAANTNNANFSG